MLFLHINYRSPPLCVLGHYKYHLNAMHVDSRSGHTSHLIGGILTIVGGRNDKMFELHQGFKGPYQGAAPSNSVIQEIWKISKQLPAMEQPPGGRKLHVAITGGGGVLIHGGETFDGKRESSGEMFLLTLKPHLNWFHLGNSGISRAGHVICASADKVVIHGGFTGKSDTVMGDSYELEVSSISK